MSPLKVLNPKPPIKPSKRSRWRAASLVLVHVLIGAHIAHWLVTGSTMTPIEPSEAMAFSRSGVVNAGLVFFAAMILTTAFFGRLFCGWACHVVALQDLCRWILVRFGLRPTPLRSRWLRWVPIVAFVYMFLWPAFYRWWVGNPFHLETEWTTSDFWATFPGWVIGSLTLLVCGFGAVYFLGAKGFCTYACPYGAIFGVVDRLAPMRIRVTDACAGCGHCTAVCTSNVRVHEEVRDHGLVVDSGCMKCLDCVSVCPNQALYYGRGPLPGTRHPSERSRGTLDGWEEVVLLFAFLAAFLTFRGLYRLIPFLLALGWAAILAFVVLQAVRMVKRPNLTFRRIALRRQHRWTRAGQFFMAGFTVLLLFWGHSSVVRLHQFWGERGNSLIAFARPAVLDLSAQVEPLSDSAQKRANRALRASEWVERWGWISVQGDAAKRAWLSYLGGRSEAAVRAHLEAAIGRGENEVEMLFLGARLASEHGRPAQALDDVRRAVEIVPESALAQQNLGVVLAELGDLRNARAAFERSLTLAETPSGLYGLALTHALGGRSELAMNLFRRVLGLDPQHVPALENLAGLLASLGRYDESVLYFRKAVELREDADTRVLLARVLYLKGEEEKAIKELERVFSSRPEHPLARELQEQWRSRRSR